MRPARLLRAFTRTRVPLVAKHSLWIGDQQLHQIRAVRARPEMA